MPPENSSTGGVANRKRPPVQAPTTSRPRVNFYKLDTTALRRYRKMYKMNDVGPSATKELLVTAISKHFAAQTVDEVKTIAKFVEALKKRRFVKESAKK